MHPQEWTSPAEVAAALEQAGYLADEGIATSAFLAVRMRRPLLLEGEPGVGKTALAIALAEITGSRLIRLQCYEGIDAAQALYDWDFPRQILHLRASEHRAADPDDDPDAVETSLYARRFLIARPILQALEHSPSLLLVDEIDRADDEFEALLLEVLADNAVTIPEIGTIRAEAAPLVVLTSNRTREVHDAVKRRCLYHWLPAPDTEREIEIVRRQVPDATAQLTAQVVAATQRMRQLHLVKPPGIAETIDWAHALTVLGAATLAAEFATATLGAAVKYHEDVERVRAELLADLPAAQGG